MPSRRKVLMFAAAAILTPGAAFALLYRRFPSDHTPEGAYMRIARAVAAGDPRSFFAYLETEAQWACYTLRDMRKKAREVVTSSYPEPKAAELAASYAALANAPDGSDVFALLYAEHHWERRLRKDLSGAVRTDIDPSSDRATIVTARGTRWPFRRRNNGIWGLTIFTAELLAEAEKATRDLAVVEAAASDYAKLRSGG